MHYVIAYVKSNKEPITQKEIIFSLAKEYPETNIKAAIKTLIKKSYMRRSAGFTKPAKYVLMRTVA